MSHMGIVTAHSNHAYHGNQQQSTIDALELTTNGIPYSTRAHWMRIANQALILSETPCQFGAFAAAIVNHTSTNGLGDLICTGTNGNARTGNPTHHGEMVAINNCTSILTDPAGQYKLSPSQAAAAFQGLTLYTNAESCPMCASAIRWAGFKEYVYGTSIDRLIETGWGQIAIPSVEVVERSWGLGTSTRVIAELLTNETDPWFSWQYQPKYPCPYVCKRNEKGICALE